MFFVLIATLYTAHEDIIGVFLKVCNHNTKKKKFFL